MITDEVDHRSDHSYHGLTTLSQKHDHEKRSDHASDLGHDLYCDHALLDHKIFSLGQPNLKRQNLDPEKALWEHPYIGLSELLLCSPR